MGLWLGAWGFEFEVFAMGLEIEAEDLGVE